jgi:hypothetical protein
MTPPPDEAFNVLGRSEAVLIEGGGFKGLKMKPRDKQLNRLCKKLIGMGLEVLTQQHPEKMSSI